MISGKGLYFGQMLKGLKIFVTIIPQWGCYKILAGSPILCERLKQTLCAYEQRMKMRFGTVYFFR